MPESAGHGCSSLMLSELQCSKSFTDRGKHLILSCRSRPHMVPFGHLRCLHREKMSTHFRFGGPFLIKRTTQALFLIGITIGFGVSIGFTKGKPALQKVQPIPNPLIAESAGHGCWSLKVSSLQFWKSCTDRGKHVVCSCTSRPHMVPLGHLCRKHRKDISTHSRFGGCPLI